LKLGRPGAGLDGIGAAAMMSVGISSSHAKQKQLEILMKRKFLIGFALLTIWLMSIGVEAAAGQTVKFADISKNKNVQGLWIGEAYRYGHGIACADINQDGLPDFYVSNAVEVDSAVTFPEVFYLSKANAAYNEEASVRRVLDSYGIGSHGVVFFDYDNDGDFDLFNANTGATPVWPTIYHRLYRNNGSGVFGDLSKTAGVQALPSFARSAAVFDANNDGYMDIYTAGADPTTYAAVPNQFYINKGDGTFTMVDWGAKNVNSAGFGPNGVTAADYDEDGDVDIYVSIVDRLHPTATHPANQFFVKQADGTYVDKAQELGVLGLGWSDGATFADYDNDGDLDLFVSSSNDKVRRKVCVYQNQGNGAFVDLTDEVSIYQRGFTPVLFDVDNDGDLDLLTPSNIKAQDLMRLYLNDGHGHFSKQENSGLEVAIYDTRGASVADIDNDGDLDIYLTDTNKIGAAQYYNHLFQNQLSNTNRWLKICGRGPKGDAGAFGSKIWVFEKGYMDDLNHLIGYKQIISTYGFCSQDDPVQHFGLGQRDTVDVKIVLTDSTVLKYPRTAGNRKITFSKPGSIRILSGNHQSGLRNQTLPLPLRVQVRDQNNQPLARTAIRFNSKNGTVVQAQPMMTDANGYAQVNFILGSQATVQTVAVTVPSLPNVQADFIVHLQSTPNEMQLMGPAQRSGQAGAVLTDSIKVRILDKDRYGYAGLPVTFELLSGTGSLLPGDQARWTIDTKADGNAAVAWKLGKAAGALLQSMRIRAEYLGAALSGSPVTLTAAVVFPDTLQLAKQDGDQQTGQAGSVLIKPLTVKVSSITGLLVPPLPIRFKVASGGGKVNDADSAMISTDANGLASISWRLGADFQQTQRLLAWAPSSPSHQVIFTAQATPVARQLHYSGASERYGQVNRSLDDPVTVRVTDDQGHPVADYAVLFSIIAGGGKVNGRDSVQVQTNADGISSCNWLLGPKSGTRNNRVAVVAAGLSGSPLNLYASAAPGRPFSLMKISGDKQNCGPFRQPPLPMRVQVTDSLLNGIAKQAVQFAIIQGDALISGSTQTSALTDSLGFAEVRITMGSVTGTVRVSAASSDAGQALRNSPVVFQATLSPAIAKSLVYSGPPAYTGQAGSLLPDPVVVQVMDDGGFPVKGFEVIYQVVHGGGKVNDKDSVHVHADEHGAVQAFWRMGPVSGVLNNRLRITAGSLQGSPLELQATASAGRAFKLTKIAGDDQSGGPRSTAPIPLTVLITDSLQNKIAGHMVLFQVKQGDATLNGASHLTLSTDSSGRAQAAVKFGLNPGVVQIEASAQVDGKGLSGSPLVFTATVTPAIATRLVLLSGVELYGQAGRALHDSLVARVTDDWGTPIVEHPITFKVLAGHGKVNGKDSVTVLTDGQGYGRCCWLLGSQSTTRANELAVKSAGLAGSPVHLWATGLAPKAFHLSLFSGNGQSGTPLSTLTQFLQVQVLDSLRYPVAQHPVTFLLQQGDAHFQSNPSITVYTDSDGIAATAVTLGVTPGMIRISAEARTSAVPLQGSPVAFDASLVLPAIDRHFSRLMADTLAIADGRATLRLQAMLRGSQNQPLPGLQVRFQCSGTANALIQPAGVSTAEGLVVASLTSTKAEVKNIWAQILHTAIVLDTVRVRFSPGPAAVLKKVSGNDQSAPIGRALALPLVMAVTDSFANPVVAVLALNETWPDASQHALANVTTTAEGLVRYSWTMSGLAGEHHLQVSCANLAPVTFQAKATAREVGQLKTIHGNAQAARPGSLLAEPVVVQVQDTFQEPLAGVIIHFQIIGGGAVYPQAKVVADSQGLAAVTWRLGLAGEQKLIATVENRQEPNVAIQARLLENHIPTLSCVKDTTIQEGQQLLLMIKGSDADLDSLIFGCEQLPDSASIDSLSGRFVWTPGYRSAGISKIVFWGRDFWGGRNTATATITVLDVPQPPTITTFTPMDSVVRMDNENISFAVTAIDLDGNYLYYTWWLNDVLVAASGTGYLLRHGSVVSFPSRLAVRVSDGLNTVEHSWTVDMASGVAAAGALPTEFALLQNYPNPFNPRTRIPFAVAQTCRVRVCLYDDSGRRVRLLEDRLYAAGHHEVEWDGCDDAGAPVSSGLFLCTMTAGHYQFTRKMILMR